MLFEVVAGRVKLIQGAVYLTVQIAPSQSNKQDRAHVFTDNFITSSQQSAYRKPVTTARVHLNEQQTVVWQ